MVFFFFRGQKCMFTCHNMPTYIINWQWLDFPMGLANPSNPAVSKSFRSRSASCCWSNSRPKNLHQGQKVAASSNTTPGAGHTPGLRLRRVKPRNGTWDFFLMFFFGTNMEKHVDVHQLKLSLPLKPSIYIYNIDILEYAGFVRGSAVWYTTLAFACHRVKH